MKLLNIISALGNFLIPCYVQKKEKERKDEESLRAAKVKKAEEEQQPKIQEVTEEEAKIIQAEEEAKKEKEETKTAEKDKEEVRTSYEVHGDLASLHTNQLVKKLWYLTAWFALIGKSTELMQAKVIDLISSSKLN